MRRKLPKIAIFWVDHDAGVDMCWPTASTDENLYVASHGKLLSAPVLQDSRAFPCNTALNLSQFSS